MGNLEINIMNGTDLTNRLINDIKNVIKAKKQTREYYQLMKEVIRSSDNPEYEMNYSPAENFIAITILLFPHHLTIFSEFINAFVKLIEYDPSYKMDIEGFLTQIEGKSEVITSTFDKIIADSILIFISDSKQHTISSILFEKLDLIHDEAESVVRNLPNVGKKCFR